MEWRGMDRIGKEGRGMERKGSDWIGGASKGRDGMGLEGNGTQRKGTFYNPHEANHDTAAEENGWDWHGMDRPGMEWNG